MNGSRSISLPWASVSGGLRRQEQLSADPLHDVISAGQRVRKNVVGPAAAMLLETPALMPCTAADITVTTKTPTAMPRMVSPARTLLDLIASNAISTPSKRFVSQLRKVTVVSSRAKRGICSSLSLLPHSENRIQTQL